MKIQVVTWLCLCLLPGPASAARDAVRDLGVRVLDQDGAPLQDAVVTLRPAQDLITPRPADTTAVMDQRGKLFVPHVLVVRPGTRVEFPNSDHVRHHVYSFSPPKPFELKLYARSEVPSVTFDQPGVVSLGCNIHDWMQGYIYITEEPRFALSAEDGNADFTGLAEGAYRMRIWHPRLRGPYLGAEYTLELSAATPARIDYRITLRSRQPAQQPPPGADMDPAYGQRF